MKVGKSSIDVFSEETLKFVQRHLPGRDSRVLEVGCGTGYFSLQLMQTGVQLTACDTDEKAVLLCKERGVPAIHIDFLSIKDELYDVILFTRSLHHIHKLNEAIDRANSLLVPGGILLIEDFDVHMMDSNTARWYYDTRSIVSVCTNNKKPSAFVQDPMKLWVEDHVHVPPLHSGSDMIKAIKEKFNTIHIERNAYLYRSICGALDSYKNGYQITAKVLEIENGLIHEEIILPNGLRLVAEKRK